MEKLAELSIKDNTKLVLSKGEFRGSDRIDIRQHFLKEEEGDQFQCRMD